MTTCNNLTLPGFGPMASDPSSASAAASPARTSARPARVPAWTVSDPASGESLRVSLANFDPATRSWRTSGLYAVEDSPLYSQTLPRSGMTRSGTLYLLPPLVRLTSAIVCGSSRIELAPTPTARLGDDSGRTIPSAATASNRWEQGRRNLDDWAALLPTPTAADYGSTNNGTRDGVMPYRAAGKPSLSTMARRGLIPTPTASDANGAGSRNTATSATHPGLSLNDWARGDGGAGRLLPSPSASDERNCADYSDRSRGHSPQLRHLGKGRLNPRFVAWMMGFPLDWLDLD